MSKKDLPSPEYLRQRLRYEPETGQLIWREYDKMPGFWNTRFANTIAGNIDPCHGYCIIGIDGVKHRVHRVIWAMFYGFWPVNHIDHIDGNKINNRIDNLRDVENRSNHLNRAIPKSNKSGVIGVCWHNGRGKWRADIKVDGISRTIGYFTNFEDATAARKQAEVKFCFHENHGRGPIAVRSIS